jgi:hypothetical protein
VARRLGPENATPSRTSYARATVSTAIGYAMHSSPSHDAVISVLLYALIKS